MSTKNINLLWSVHVMLVNQYRKSWLTDCDMLEADALGMSFSTLKKKREILLNKFKKQIYIIII